MTNYATHAIIPPVMDPRNYENPIERVMARPNTNNTHERDIALYGGAGGDGLDGALVFLVKLWLLISLLATLAVVVNAVLRFLFQ